MPILDGRNKGVDTAKRFVMQLGPETLAQLGNVNRDIAMRAPNGLKNLARNGAASATTSVRKGVSRAL